MKVVYNYLLNIYILLIYVDKYMIYFFFTKHHWLYEYTNITNSILGLEESLLRNTL